MVLAGRPRAERRTRADEVLAALSLTDRATTGRTSSRAASASASPSHAP